MTDGQATSIRRKGLFMAIAASLVLFTLAGYKVPVFYDELQGVVIGVYELHNETGTELVATVQLETGAQIHVSMSRDLLSHNNANIRVSQGRSLFGSTSYRVIE